MTYKYKIAAAGILAVILLVLLKVNDRKILYMVAEVRSPYVYSFNVPGVLNETGSMAESPSAYWWVNSGGIMSIVDGTGRTNLGELPPLSRWRLVYKLTNPVDTDNGYHPQNIFRLISRNSWKDFSEQAYFRIIKDNLSDSPNRNVSNGLLLISRYQDQNNLYYAGLRVDGTAVIKKKRNGEYTTLAQNELFSGEYDHENNPDLMPKMKWLGIKSEVENVGTEVVIRLYYDETGIGDWRLLLTATDNGDLTGTPILDAGFAGIRTDFLDVEFRDFKVEEL